MVWISLDLFRCIKQITCFFFSLVSYFLPLSLSLSVFLYTLYPAKLWNHQAEVEARPLESCSLITAGYLVQPTPRDRSRLTTREMHVAPTRAVHEPRFRGSTPRPCMTNDNFRFFSFFFFFNENFHTRFFFLYKNSKHTHAYRHMPESRVNFSPDPPLNSRLFFASH